MAEVSSSLQLKFGYDNTDFTRSYVLEGVASSVISDIGDKIEAVNQSLASGTAGGLSSFFVSDNGDYFIGIVEAKLVTVEETVLDLGGNE